MFMDDTSKAAHTQGMGTPRSETQEEQTMKLTELIASNNALLVSRVVSLLLVG